MKEKIENTIEYWVIFMSSQLRVNSSQTSKKNFLWIICAFSNKLNFRGK